MNKERFISQEYETERKIKKETRVEWVPINSQMREEVVYKVQLTELELQDQYYQFS